MEEIARNVDRILVLRGSHVYMDGTPRQVFAAGRRSGGRGPGRAPGHQDCPGSAPDGPGRSTRRSTPWTSWSRRCWLRQRGGGRMLKDITLGQFFPGDTVDPPAGPPHQAHCGDPVYRGSVQRQGRGNLRHGHGGAGSVHSGVPGALPVTDPGPEAHLHHRGLHGHYEPVFHQRHALGEQAGC